MDLQHGYLLIADVSGYTKFVAAKELEHSNVIISQLLRCIVQKVQSVFEVVKLEGDAAFAYFLDVDKKIDVIKFIKTVYENFRQELSNIEDRSPCGCDACSGLDRLDLKFFLHIGEFIIQDIVGIKDLIGNDVNIIHRITKNSLAQKTGWKSYLMLTEEVKTDLNLSTGFFELNEKFDDIGEIKTYSMII